MVKAVKKKRIVKQKRKAPKAAKRASSTDVKKPTRKPRGKNALKTSGFKLGAGSKAELKGVDKRLVQCVELAIVKTTQDFTVYDGLRTAEEQLEYYRRGTSKVRKSKHQVGKAVDLVPFINGKLRWEWPACYPIAQAMLQAADEVGVRLKWGGVWDKPGKELRHDQLEAEVVEYVARKKAEYERRGLTRAVFIDGPHFEIIGR